MAEQEVVDRPQTSEDTWAIVELMGHVKLAGKLSEVERFGSKMGRLDIPNDGPCDCPNAHKTQLYDPTVPCDKCHGAGFVRRFITQFFGGSSVYRITHVTEAVARQVAKKNDPAPVHPWDFPKQLGTVVERCDRCDKLVGNCTCYDQDPDDQF
jgi:hypothetical protein